MSEKLYYIDIYIYMHIVFFLFYFVNIKGTVNVLISGHFLKESNNFISLNFPANKFVRGLILIEGSRNCVFL